MKQAKKQAKIAYIASDSEGTLKEFTEDYIEALQNDGYIIK